MRKYLLLAATAAIALAAPAARATTISITDDWVQQSATHKSAGFELPTLATGNGITTSNDGSVNTQLDNTAQTETVGTSATNYLFVVKPADTGSHISYGTIPIQFTLSDSNGATTGSATFTAYMEYFANAGNDQDDIDWSASASTLPSSTYAPDTAGSISFDETLSNGSVIDITLHNQVDWNMAQTVSYDVVSVPAPAIGHGLWAMLLIGGVLLRHRAWLEGKGEWLATSITGARFR